MMMMMMNVHVFVVKDFCFFSKMDRVYKIQ